MKQGCLAWCVWCLLSVSVQAQGTKADYERAASLNERYQSDTLNLRPRLVWQTDGQQFVYRQQLPEGKQKFLRVDVRSKTRVDAFDHVRLAADLAIQLKKPVDPEKLPFSEVELGDTSSEFFFRIEGTRWKYDRWDGTLTRSPGTGAPSRAPFQRQREFIQRISPDRQWRLFVKDHNVFLAHQQSGKTEQLTKDGTAAEPYVERFYWAPHSRKVMLLRVKPAQERKVYLIESSPRDQLQPRLHEMNYLKPGDELAKTTLVLADIPTRHLIKVADKLFPNPYALSQYAWSKDSARFTFLYNQRGHQLLRWLSVDADTGYVQCVIDEPSKTFVDYAGKFFLHPVKDKREAIWMSERDGWNHLYLIDTERREVKNQITRGNWVVRRVVKVDDDKRQIWFTCSGVYAEQDPYYLHLARVHYDGSDLKILTAEDGTHTTEFSPTGEYFVDTWSRVDKAPVTVIRSSQDGQLLLPVEEGDITRLKSKGWRPPERFVAKGRDGTTNIYGVIHRPSNFSPTKKYPVIEYIYAGPQDSFVPKEFRPVHRVQAMAELGFIVVQMDGMGTSNRSKAFHDVCWKNLGDAGFPDRMLWIKAAAAKYPYMDLTRIGIYGGSAGGQNAMRGLLMHPDFYHVGVADCGCHDNRMDKIWWNELWMSWPIGPHYAEQSNVTQAHRLQGKLLLIVGEMDRNVDPASTMQVVNALIKANKDFDMIVVPGGPHGAAESPYMSRRRADFFVRHLHGVEPRSK